MLDEGEINKVALNTPKIQDGYRNPVKFGGDLGEISSCYSVFLIY